MNNTKDNISFSNINDLLVSLTGVKLGDIKDNADQIVSEATKYYEDYKANRKTDPDYDRFIRKIEHLLSEISKRKLHEIGEKVGEGINVDSFFTQDDAHRFVPHFAAREYLRIYPHVLTEYKGTIHQFVGNHWLKDGEGAIRSIMETASAGLIKSNNIRDTLDAIENLTRIIDPASIDLPMENIMPFPDHVVPLIDGLLNLDTKTLSDHTPRYYYTEYLPRRYIPGAKPEIFQALLDALFKGDPEKEKKVTQIYETIAWTLMSKYNIHGTVIFYGQGGEGKSILHNVIGDLLVHTTSLSLKEVENDKFKRAELYGSWANLVSESTSDLITSEWFKRLTDGTIITVDRKNGHPFQFSSRAKFILDVNELPNKENELRAFYRRVIAIIDFPNRLEDVLSPDQIDQIVKALKDEDELNKLFSFVVDNYYHDLVTRMKFTGQLSIADAEKQWTERSNPALSYLRMKMDDGDIYTDPEDVKALLVDRPDLCARYITRDKWGSEYLTMIKQDVISAAIKWGTERGFPTKTIHGGSLGKALLSLGLPNMSVSKTLEKHTTLKAWKDIYIHDKFEGNVDNKTELNQSDTKFGKASAASVCENRPTPQNVSYSLGEMKLGVGQNPMLANIMLKQDHNNREGRKPSDAETHSTLENSGKKLASGDSADPTPKPTPTIPSESSNTTKHGVQSETPPKSEPESHDPITLEDGNLIRDQLLNLGYIIDPNSGKDINEVYYKIGIVGSTAKGEKLDKLFRIMQGEKFDLFNDLNQRIIWYRRPLRKDTN